MTDLIRPDISDEEIDSMSSLALAHVGDAVFELLIRTWACKNKALTSENMHKTAVSYVNAHAQAEFSKKILGFLSDEEMRVFKRGRNAKSGSVAKNADIITYKHATTFEALIGYLYLKNQIKRIDTIINFIVGD